MSGCWILKTEPSTYSYDDLAREGTATWDGVKNAVALKHLRAMKPGDRALVYHTGDEKACVGLAEVTRGGYPDPRAGEPLVVVDLTAAGKLARPVTLAEIRAEKTFADLALVRMPRLSVVPCSEVQYEKLLALSRMEAPR
jgi:predicted RNA-binding protein with PUA-like domain